MLKVTVFSLALTGSLPAVACVWNKAAAEMSEWKKEYLWFSFKAEKVMISTFYPPMKALGRSITADYKK